MVGRSSILVLTGLMLLFGTALEARRTTSPSFLVGERLRSHHANSSGRRARPWELGAGIYREMDIMEKESHQQNGVSLSEWPNARWPNAVVPYLFTGTFTDEQKAVVLTAMAQFAANTCVRFVAQTTETVYISITSSATGCWSYVGRSLSNTYNVVNLQTPSCITVETAAHELMHSIGFYHEFTRPDRDEYVTIDREALAPQYQTEEFYRDNYGKYSDNQVVLYGRPYDYGSVMHYSKYAAAASRSRPVMNNLKPWTGDFGNDNGLSAADIIDINYMYCNATTSTTIPQTSTTTRATTTTIQPTTTPATTSTIRATTTTIQSTTTPATTSTIRATTTTIQPTTTPATTSTIRATTSTIQPTTTPATTSTIRATTSTIQPTTTPVTSTKSPTTTTVSPWVLPTCQPLVTLIQAGQTILGNILNPINNLIQLIGSLPIFQLFG